MTLRLNADQHQYMQSTRKAGFVALVHRQHDTVTADTSGIYLGPGYEIDVGITMVKLSSKKITFDCGKLVNSRMTLF